MRTLLTLALLLPAFALLAQSYRIEGRVLDPEGKPLPGAHVRLVHPWGEEVQSTATDARGRFLLQNVPRGGYALTVSF
ncbi:MAG: carboxypeptidase regulatory-like domain-containing protein, partial [Bacteroidetes bacterium]